jgi:hypothetical protein
MTFDDLLLYRAVYNVRSIIPKPSAEKWTGTHRRFMYAIVLDQLVKDPFWPEDALPWSLEKTVEAWLHVRKVKKMRLTCRVANIHGARCFWAHRVPGKCSDELDLDRLVTGYHGGRYSLENCIISCSFHNRSRGNLTVEEYLRSAEPALQ